MTKTLLCTTGRTVSEFSPEECSGSQTTDKVWTLKECRILHEMEKPITIVLYDRSMHTLSWLCFCCLCVTLAIKAVDVNLQPRHSAAASQSPIPKHKLPAALWLAKVTV